MPAQLLNIENGHIKMANVKNGHVKHTHEITENFVTQILQDKIPSINYRSGVKHILTICGLFSVILLMEFFNNGLPLTKNPFANIKPVEQYGYKLTVLLYVIKFLSILTLPMAIFNVLGVILFNPCAPKPKLKFSLLSLPHLSFRVVTRGLYPNLVKERVDENIKIITELGLNNYQFEIVTDNPIWINNDTHRHNVRQILVPSDYKTKNGTLFKARALHYCLEPGVSRVGQCDWIVHLDEETAIARSSLVGILNFVGDGKYDFGQGVISYAKIKIVNWITTLIDSVRTGFDYGLLRFTLGYLHRPVFSWKGSFIVARVSAERDIGFDFGPEGSITEDTFFALKAWSQGYTFDIVQGEMREMSPFNIRDLIKQRARWVHGITLTFFSSKIPIRYKFGIACMVFVWFTLPFQIANVILSPIYPVPVIRVFQFILVLPNAVVLFMFIFGADKSFYRRNRPLRYRILINILSVINMLLLAGVFEVIAVFWQALIGRLKTQFYIIQKEQTNDTLIV